MPADKHTSSNLLRWIILSTLAGGAIGLGIGLVKNMLELTLPIGIGLGFILGMVLALQQQAEK